MVSGFGLCSFGRIKGGGPVVPVRPLLVCYEVAGQALSWLLRRRRITRMPPSAITIRAIPPIVRAIWALEPVNGSSGATCGVFLMVIWAVGCAPGATSTALSVSGEAGRTYPAGALIS